MPTNQQFINKLLTQKGKKYIFGYEVSPSNQNPKAFDCSELIEWGLAQIGVKFPDGSANQIARCRNISVADGLRIPGALLWKPGHIATSLGNNTTIEAKGRNYGVGVFSAVGRFTKAGLIPDLTYVSASLGQPTVNLAAIAAGIAAAKKTTLKRGAKGNNVIWLQEGLNQLSGAELKVDGDFGPSTENAVKALQGFLGGKTDGIVTPALWAIIFP